MVKKLLILFFPFIFGMLALIKAQNYSQMTFREAFLLFKRKKGKI